MPTVPKDSLPTATGGEDSWCDNSQPT